MPHNSLICNSSSNARGMLLVNNSLVLICRSSMIAFNDRHWSNTLQSSTPTGLKPSHHLTPWMMTSDIFKECHRIVIENDQDTIWISLHKVELDRNIPNWWYKGGNGRSMAITPHTHQHYKKQQLEEQEHQDICVEITYKEIRSGKESAKTLSRSSP